VKYFNAKPSGLSNESSLYAAVSSSLQYRNAISESLGTTTAWAVISLVCLLLSLVVWWPFAWLGRLIHRWTPAETCSLVAKSTFATCFCGVKVALEAVVIPATLILALWFFRKNTVTAVSLLARRLPIASQRLLAPVVATLLFAFCWDWVHYDAPYSVGLLPQIAFPTSVGVLTALGELYRKAIDSGNSRKLFFWNEKSLGWLRIAAVGLVLSVLSTMISAHTTVQHAVLKEQVVVLSGIVLGNLFLVFRGELARAASRRSEFGREHA